VSSAQQWAAATAATLTVSEQHVYQLGHVVAQSVEAPRYNPEGHGSISDGVTVIFH
jgi:hypothetical protein